MNNRHLIVVSADAFIYEDIEYCKTLPTLGKLILEGAVIEKNLTVYPSETHTVHATMMTGCHPAKTGITSNHIFEGGESSGAWYNRLSEVNSKTIFDAARENGLTTAVCFWPCTAGGADRIDYLVPEVFGKITEENSPIDAYSLCGTTKCVMDIVEEGIAKIGYTAAHPGYDELEIYIACEIFRRFKPNLLMTHPAYIDNARHRSGVFGGYVKEALDSLDGWVAQLLKAVSDAGLSDKTDIVIMGDHGHLNYSRVVNPNVFLQKRGYITLDENGNVSDWLALAHSAGLSCQIYLKNPNDKLLSKRIYTELCEMAKDGIYGFERVFTADEVYERYGLRGGFSFVLETDGISKFENSVSGAAVINNQDFTGTRSSHGHMPEKGPQPTFIAFGPHIKKGVRVAGGMNVNHAPTFAKILGFELPFADGKPQLEIIKN